MADKDLDALTADLKKAAVNTVALSVAQLAVKRVTDQLAATVGAFDKQVAKAAKDVEDLASGMSAFNKAASQAASNTKSMTEAFDGLLGALTPLSAALKEVGDRLDGATISIQQSSTAINIHNQNLTQLQSISIQAAQGQGAVAEAMGKTESAADKSAEKLKKVHETAKELGGSMIDAVSALASGEEPMKVLTDKGGEMAKTLLNAKLDGVNLMETFKTLGVAMGILKVTSTEAAAAQMVGAAAMDATAISAKGATAAAGELAAVEGVALAPLGAALGAVALAAGAIGVGFAVGADQINKSNGDLTKGLGLTEEQLARVTDKTATMGDVFQATLNVIGRHIMDSPIGDALKGLQSLFGDVLKSIVDRTLDGVTTFLAFWGAAYDTLTKHWSNLPLAFSAIFTGLVNISIRHVETMINGWLGGYGKLADLVQKITGFKLPKFTPIDLPELKAVGGAAGQSIADEFMASLDGKKNAMKRGATRYVKGFLGEVSDETVGIVQDRIVKQGGAVAKKAAGGGRTAQSSAKPVDYSNVVYQESVSVVQDARVEGTRPAALNIEGLKTFEDPISKQLDGLIKKLTDINALAPELGKHFEAAFGKAGKALGGVLTSFSAYSLEVAKINREAAGRDLTPEEREKRTQAQVKGYAAMASAAQGFFKENSAGYKALEVAEIAFNTIHTLNTIKGMALDTTSAVHTTTTQAVKQGAYGATAYAHALADLPFPLNLLAGATIIAALVQAGAAIKGKGGGAASAPGANDMKTRQDAQGTGSVLGDSKAKSDSLEKALTFAEAYQNKDLEYGNAMVRSLKSIDDQIGAVAAALAKSFAAGGMLSTEGLNLGKTGTSASLSNFGFGKTTSRTLQDQGVQFDAASLSDIIAGGLSGSTYQQVLETTKKKALFMPVGSKSKVITETGALDGDFVDQITKLIASLGKGVADAGKAIKATGVEEVLASFKVDLGKLSFKDMTGAQIEEALNAIFGKLGDDMAKAAVPAIAEFQKVGEGAFETLVRVARQYEVIDTTLKSVGMQFGEVGLASLEARERLVDLVGGLDNLTDQTSFFAEHFLSEGERLKPVQDSVAAELKRLELPADLSREGFKNLVLAQNLSTEKGAELYAALMALAPAFDKVATAAENSTSAIAETAAKMVSDAQAGVDTARSNLQAAYDAEKTRLQKIVDDAGAAESALRSAYESQASTIQSTIDRLKSFSQATKDFGRSLLTGDQSGASTSQRYDATRTEFERIRGLALSGDETAQGQFQSAAQDFLKAASENASTAIGYLADLGVVKSATDQLGQYADSQTSVAEQQLAQLKSQVGALIDLGGDVKSVETAINDLLTARQAASTAEDQLKALDAQVAGLIELNASTLSVRDAVNALNAALLALANARTAQSSGAGWTSSYGGVAVPTNPGYANPYGDNGAVLGQADAVGKNNAGQVTFFDYTAAELAWTSSPLELGGMKTDAALALVELKKMYGPNVLPGFARGGAFMIGGFAGVDQNLLSINGAPAARVGQGEIVTITPPGRAANDNSWGEVLAELRSLRAEVAQLRQDGRTIGVATVKAVNQPQWAQDWDVEGMPEERKA